MTFRVPCPVRSCDYIAEGGDGISAETYLFDHLQNAHGYVTSYELRRLLGEVATALQVAQERADYWEERWRSSQ